MVDRTPLRLLLDELGNPAGLAEFRPDETIPVSYISGLAGDLSRIDALLQVLVQTVGENTPPTGVEGQRFIVGTAPTGAWAGQANKLARFLDGAWQFFDARHALNAADGLWYVRSAATWSPLAGGGGGEANTASNLGAGEGLYASKVGVDLQFKSLVEGTNITITSDGDTVTINAAGGSGGDMLSQLVSSEVGISSATTLTASAFGKMHVCSGVSSNYTVTLPSAAGNSGKIIGIRMSGALSKLVTLSGAASDLIDGQSSRVLWKLESAILLCDGGSWTKIAGKSIPMTFKATSSAAESLPSSTLKKVTLGASESYPSDIFNTVTSEFKNLRPGTWSFAGGANFSSGVAGGAAIVQLNRNGATSQQLAFGHTASSTNITLTGASLFQNIPTSTTITLHVFATYPTNISSYTTDFATFLSGSEVLQW